MKKKLKFIGKHFYLKARFKNGGGGIEKRKFKCLYKIPRFLKYCIYFRFVLLIEINKITN